MSYPHDMNSDAGADGLTFAPRPGAASLSRMLLSQTGLEVRMLLRNGEQLLLTIVIPVLVLTVFGSVEVMNLGTDASHAARVDFLAPGVLALAVLSTSFTGLAIGTGFERRYGALKRLGASPLPRSTLLAAKGLSVLVVEALQIALLVTIAQILGWDPRGSWLAVLLLVLAGTAAFSGLALLMAGTLRAEATLAAANLVYLLLLVTGGIAIPLHRFPDSVRQVLEALPAGALSEGLRTVLRGGGALAWSHVGVLVGWAAVGGWLTARTFKWE